MLRSSSTRERLNNPAGDIVLDVSLTVGQRRLTLQSTFLSITSNRSEPRWELSPRAVIGPINFLNSFRNLSNPFYENYGGFRNPSKPEHYSRGTYRE